MPKPSVEPSHTKNGVLYAPFVSEDVITQTMGHNLSRAGQGKTLYPVICRNDQDKVLFEKHRQDFIVKLTDKKKFTDELNKCLQQGATEEQVRQAIGPECFDNAMKAASQFRREIDVLTRMCVYSNEDHQALANLLPDNEKLYIVGHGGPGMNILAADEACQNGIATAKDVAQQLREGGLHTAFHDFRVKACHSADTSLPASFNAKELARASKPKTHRTGGVLGLFGKKEIEAEPFAQTLSNELKTVGFEQPNVAGYHGAGVTISAEDHHYRRLPESQESNIRSSSVRKRFIPV